MKLIMTYRICNFCRRKNKTNRAFSRHWGMCKVRRMRAPITSIRDDRIGEVERLIRYVENAIGQRDSYEIEASPDSQSTHSEGEAPLPDQLLADDDVLSVISVSCTNKSGLLSRLEEL